MSTQTPETDAFASKYTTWTIRDLHECENFARSLELRLTAETKRADEAAFDKEQAINRVAEQMARVQELESTLGTSMSPNVLKIRTLQAEIARLREIAKRVVKAVREIEGDDFLSDISEIAEDAQEALSQPTPTEFQAHDSPL